MVVAGRSLDRSGAGGDVLSSWAEKLSGRAGKRARGVLRFAFYGRVSTEDWQDPVTSRARQLQQALMLAAGVGVIVAEFFDTGESRELPWARRPQAAALVAQLADPERGWDAVVIGEYERAFYGNQYASMAPLFEHYGVSLWMPEVGGGWTGTPRTTSRPCSRSGCRPSGRSPGQGARGVGAAGAPARAGSGDGAGRVMDVRPAAGRALRRADHPRAE